MDATSTIEVDLSSIEHNVAMVRRACSASGGKQVGVCAVIKADAYGLGAPRIAKRLEIAAVEMMAVFTPEQARALVEAAIQTPILILMPVRSIQRTDPLYRAVLEGRLHLSVHDEEQLEALAGHADQFGVRLPLHVEVNTGMNRGGSRPDAAERMVRRIAKHPRLALAGVSTHFASPHADGEAAMEQSAAFSRWLARVAPIVPRECVAHQASTFATFRSSELHADMVRVGLALLGYGSEEILDADECELIEHARALKPAVRWLSRVVHTSVIEEGQPVGYGATWRARRPTRLALIPVGYADGFPAALSNRAKVGFRAADGARFYAPVVGRVSMDQITVDATDVPEAASGVGAEVEIIGADRRAPNHLPTLARSAGTISHELLCRLSPRTPRVYRAVDRAVERAEKPAGTPRRSGTVRTP